MLLNIGFVMDPIASIKIKKDSTFAMILSAQRRGWRIFYMEMGDLFSRDGHAFARMQLLTVDDNPHNWYQLGSEIIQPLEKLDIILMRKDPPFDLEYIIATYLLEQAQQNGCLVVNHPRSLRDANEKFFTTAFPHCTPPTLITRQANLLKNFYQQYHDIILKPLDGMGGASVFRVVANDLNFTVIIETLTAKGTRFCMAQKFIPEISLGDKRILLINGEPVPYCLARIPAPGELRGNLAAGATGEGRELTEHDRWIAAQVGPELRARGILFAGLDIIGEFLTEINITSPTGIRELDKFFKLDIAGQFLTCLENCRMNSCNV